VPLRIRLLKARVWVSAALGLALLVIPPSPALRAEAPADASAASTQYPADYDLPDGHFYTQTNGAAQDKTRGYAVTDGAGIPMWSELRRLGGVGALGYPVSTRYQSGAFIEQAFQKAILQWRPDQGQAALLNVMDELHLAGQDTALQANRQIPPQASTFSDAGKSWDQVVRDRLQLLDFPNPAFKSAFAGVADPLATFGLPTSAITDEGASYTLRLQRTAMQLWKTDQPWAKANTVTLVNAGDLAKDSGLVPALAAQPEPGRIALGSAERTPWSGWWWPSLTSQDGPHLYDPGGPLAKYDAYVQSLGQPNPGTRQWELDHFVFSDPKLDWAGKCNGWAVASLVEPEPAQPRTVNGMTFSVADQKGLLADYYFADPAAWLLGSKDGGLKPSEFHAKVLYWIGTQRKGAILNAFNGSGQVTSLAAYRFQAVYMPDPIDPNKTHVKMTLWAADYHVAPDFVGLKVWPDEKAKTYSYFIYGDRNNPSGGDWEGDSVAGTYAHPENLWYPDLDPKDRNLFGSLTSPNLSYDVIQQILKG